MLRFKISLVLVMLFDLSALRAQEISPARMPKCTISGRVLYTSHSGSEPRNTEQKGPDADTALLQFERKRSFLRRYLVEQYDDYKCQGQWYGYLWTSLDFLIILFTTFASLLAALDFGSRPGGKYFLVTTSTIAALSATILGQFNIKNEWLMKEKGAATAQLHMVQVDNTYFSNPNAMHSLDYVYWRAILLDLNQTVQFFSDLGNVNADTNGTPSAAPTK